MRLAKTLFIDGHPAETILLEVDESRLSQQQLDRLLDHVCQYGEEFETDKEPPRDRQH